MFAFLVAYGWRFWLCSAFILLLFEGVDPGTLAPVFLAIGAFITASAVAALPHAGPDIQLLIFSAASLFSLFFLRPVFIKGVMGKSDRDISKEMSGEGQAAKISSGFNGSAEGVVIFQGTEWKARTEDMSPIDAGTGYVSVVRRDSSHLIVKNL